MKGRVLIACVVALAVCAAPWAEEPAANAAPVLPEPTIFYMGTWTAEHADISPPLRDIPPAPRRGKKTDKDDPSPLTPCGPIDGYDPVAQTTVGSGDADAPNAMPAPNVSFNAWSNDCGGCAPPDPNGDVGDTQVVVMANSTIAVYSKTGTQLLSPRDINTLWTGFGGNCETENAGDPVVLYDQFADRWLVSQFTAAGPTYYNCVALSTSADATGTWQRYAVSNGSSFPDYPKYGIWRDGYYFSTRNTSGTTGQGAYAMNRDQMLAGNLAPQIVNFLLPSSPNSYYGGDGLLPADMDGDVLPPVGSPQFFFGSMDNGGPYGAPSDAINVFEFDVDWATPANSTFTRTATVAVAAFDSTFTPCGGGRSCIPQPGTTNKIDTLSYRQRLTFRAAYRNYGTHESVALTQSVSGHNSGTANAIAGMRWYELRDPNGTPTIYQQGTYVPGATDSVHRWMGSVAMDRVGNMGLAFSASSGTVYPSIWYTGRLATDPLGTMPQGEGSIVNGAGSQTGGGNRWGDYTSLNVDPTDDCTFWHFNEFYTATSVSTWQMRVGSFTFPSCLCAVTPAAPAASGATASADNQITVSWSDAAAASITQYYLFRSTVAGGPYQQIATVADTSPGVGSSGTYSYNNTGVSGGTRYYYVVKANDGVSCTSANSNEVNALATGPCLLLPTFAGATSVSNVPGATCTLSLAWSAGTASCSGPLVYNIYRSTSSGFTPGPANLLAAAVSGTSYTDTSGLTNGTTYYYVVRAVDSSNGVEETNTVQRSGAPTGSVTTSTLTDTFEGALSGGGFDLAGWTHSAIGGTVDWVWSTARNQTPTHSWFSASQASVSNRVLTSPSFGVVGTTTLTFYHTYDFEGTTSTCYDGGTLEISTDGGTTWAVVPDAAFTAGGFTGTVNSSYSNPLAGRRAWCDGTLGTLTQVSVNLGGTYAGQTNCKIRWHEGDDSSAVASGWYVDSVVINNAGTAGTCTTAPTIPGEVAPGSTAGTSQSWTDKSTHAWPSANYASTYRVYRGIQADLPQLLNSSADSCLRFSGAGLTCTLSEDPSAVAGRFYWYLVTGVGSGGEGPAGNATAGARVVNSSGTCP